MKKVIFIFIFCIIRNIICAEPLYLEKEYIHTDEYSTFYMTKTSLKLDDDIEYGNLIFSPIVDTFIGKKTNYIILNGTVADTYFVYLVKSSPTDKYQYSCWEITYGKTKKGALYNSVKLITFTLISAESFITEKDKSGKEIKFLPEKSDFFSLGSNPWAVKADASKVINVSTKRWRHPTMKYYPISDIVFVNGFVYPDKLYLYEQNSRAKRVKISYADTSFEAELKDTGNFQVVHLPAAIDPKADNDIRLEILDYYPGTKYSDVVISGLYYMDALVK